MEKREFRVQATREEFLLRLDWNERDAVLRMDDRRKIVFDAEAMGALRKSLVDTVGFDRTRGVLRRFGYACGRHDFEQARQRLEEADLYSEQMLATGPQMHMLQGHVHVELTAFEADRARGQLLIKGIWRNSYEAEQHLRVFGRAKNPVCWSLEGYASGWASAWLGEPSIALERRCLGMNDSYCTFTVRPASQWGAQAQVFLDDLADVDLNRTISLLEQMAADLRATQARLIGSEAKYRSLFEDAPDMMMLCDPITGRLLDVNRRVVETLGFSREEILRKSLRDVHPLDEHAQLAMVIGPSIAEPVRSLALTLLGNDDERFVVETAFSLVPFAGTTVLQAIYHDITEFNRTQKALREAEELAHIGRMASAVAHEIRNPLSAIVSGIRLLTSTQRSQDELDIIYETILGEGERLDNTLSDFLQFARPRSPKRKPTDISRIVGDLVRIIESDSDAVGDATIETLWPDDLPEVSVDGDQIRQVLWNIILNGLQAMSGSGSLTVRITPHADELVRVEVSDTGGGIPQDELSRVFEPFHTTKPRGTGLGLAIARRIIQGHGGTIRIESTVSEGTTVSFTLPMDTKNADTESAAR